MGLGTFLLPATWNRTRAPFATECGVQQPHREHGHDESTILGLKIQTRLPIYLCPADDMPATNPNRMIKCPPGTPEVAVGSSNYVEVWPDR